MTTRIDSILQKNADGAEEATDATAEDDFSPPRNLNETVALTSSPTRLMPPRLFTWIFCNSNDNALRTSALRKVFSLREKV